MSKARVVGALILSPLFLLGLVFLALSAGTLGLWFVVAANKKQRREALVASAVQTFVKAGKERQKEENYV